MTSLFQSTDTAGASLFDIFAEDSLRASLKPAWDFVCKFLATRYPGYLVQTLKYSDEIYYLFLLLMEEYNLRRRAGTVTEVFYQLKRECVASPSSFRFRHAKLISLLSVVLLPYLVGKLEKHYERTKERLLANDVTINKLDIYIYEWYPVLKSFSKWLRMINYVLYLFKYSSHPFPLMKIMNIQLKYDLEPSVNVSLPRDTTTNKSLLWNMATKPLDIVSYGFSKIAPVFFYSLSFLDTFYNQESWGESPFNLDIKNLSPPDMSKVCFR